MIVIQRGVPDDLKQALVRSDVAGIDGAEMRLSDAVRISTEVWTAYYAEEIACIMGLCGASILSDRAYLWMLHTDVVEDHKLLFVRHSQMWIKEALQRYSEIWGIAVTENEPGIRWLRWLGAEFDYPSRGTARFTIRAR